MIVHFNENSTETFEDMVKEIVHTYHNISKEQKTMFEGNSKKREPEIFGKCPKCGGDVLNGKFGAYCKNKWGMNVRKAMKTELTDSQIKSMLARKSRGHSIRSDWNLHRVRSKNW